MRWIKVPIPASETICDGCRFEQDGFCEMFDDTSYGDRGELERVGGVITGTFRRLPMCIAADITD